MIQWCEDCKRVMTNAEAITALEMMQAQIEWDYPMEYAVAIDMAIEAIKEKEKMGEKDEIVGGVE